MLIMISVFTFIILVLVLLFFSRDTLFKCNHEWVVLTDIQYCRKCGEYQKLVDENKDNLLYLNQRRKK